MKKIFIAGFMMLGSVIFLSFNSVSIDARLMPHQGYELWAKALREHVNDQGRVNYEKLQNNRSDLDAFVEQLRNTNILEMSQNEKKAFWINAYNALTLRLIIDNYPLKLGGIRTINWGRPWSVKMRVAHENLTLGDIEHNILRTWDPPDPRIHFALNCASLGCPKLPNEPFDPQRLDEQLDHEAKRFINDPEKVRLDRETNTLYHSELFNWYENDFLIVAKDKLSYIKKYLNKENNAYLDTHEVALRKIKYNWGLNKQ